VADTKYLLVKEESRSTLTRSKIQMTRALQILFPRGVITICTECRMIGTCRRDDVVDETGAEPLMRPASSAGSARLSLNQSLVPSALDFPEILRASA
jgi:hypothetical protein